MSWFDRVFGISEGSPDAMRAAFHYDGATLQVRANGRAFHAGRLETPSLGDLRREVPPRRAGRSVLREVVGDAHQVHRDPRHAGATIQAASQCNLLEMVNPSVTPDDGITRYADDPTQGPACAVAAAAGTVVRNYLAPCRGGVGQTRDRQHDTFEALGAALSRGASRPFHVRNGYALLDPVGGRAAEAYLRGLDEAALDALRALVRVGVMLDTEVTLPGCGHRVTQVYASGLPLAYGPLPYAEVPRLAGLVLDAVYEATLLVAARAAARGGSRSVFLTFVGAGVFGNPRSAVFHAVERALQLRPDDGLDVAMVSFGRPGHDLAPSLARFGAA